MARKRDYKAEYRRRLERGRARGLTRSQARGHPRAGERLASETAAGKSPRPSKPDPRLEDALKRLRRGESLTLAAAAEGVSRERFRRFVHGNQLAHREGSRWIVSDDRPRRVLTISKGKAERVTVDGFDQASLWGHYMNDVGLFLRENEPEILAPYRGQGVRTSQGRFLEFETDPNALYELASADEDAFHEVYEIVQP